METANIYIENNQFAVENTPNDWWYAGVLFPDLNNLIKDLTDRFGFIDLHLEPEAVQHVIKGNLE